MRGIRFGLCLLLLLLVLPLSAAALKVMVLPGEAARVERVWQNQPPGTEPSLYPLQRVYPDQPFQVLVLARDFKRNSAGKAAIDYSLQILGPDGKSVEGPVPDLQLYHGAVPDKGGLLLSHQHLTLQFEQADIPGNYTLKVKAADSVDGSEADAKAIVTLAKLTTAAEFKSQADFNNWMSNYYRAPDPGRVFAGVRQYVASDDKGRQTGAALRLFFARVLIDNPFLRDRFRQVYGQADRSEREKLLLVLAAGGEALADWPGKLDATEQAFYDDARHLYLPDLSLPPASIAEINALWGQFYATGDIAPLRPLVAALALQTYRGVQEKLLVGAVKKTADVQAQAAMEDVYKALLWSLISHGENHSRVEKYLQVIAAEGSLDSAVQGQLEQVLQIIEKDRLEKEAGKKLQGQKQEGAK